MAEKSRLKRFHQLSISCIVALLTSVSAYADQAGPIDENGIAALAERAMRQFSVPGMAIGVVYQGKTVHAGGHGIREVGFPGLVDNDTLFKIASNTKAFTTAALAILVDEGRVSWEGRVRAYIPEFRMHDPWITAQFTVTDLLTHRSGLGRGAGDLMLWPVPNSFTREDIIYGLRYLKPVSDFRTEYAYDNLLYIVAGEIIPRVTGLSWGDFIDARIMQPLSMERCFAGEIAPRDMQNIAAPHALVDGKLVVVERNRVAPGPPVSAAAGGVVCSVSSMLIWLQTQLNRGTSPAGVKLFSEEQSRELWRPRTLLGVSERDSELNGTHFRAYGLGWRLADVHGFKEISHTGSLDGTRSYVVLVPELDLGVVLLSNGSSSSARSAVMNTIVRSYMPVPRTDWIALYAAEDTHTRQQEPAVTGTDNGTERAPPPARVQDLSWWAGRYLDPWFGEVRIALDDGQLRFEAQKSPRLSGPLDYHHGTTFVARWDDRTLEADAFVRFILGADGRVESMVMQAVSESTDFSFDFQDLDFSRVD